jgi:heptosyltransferase-3
MAWGVTPSFLDQRDAVTFGSLPGFKARVAFGIIWSNGCCCLALMVLPLRWRMLAATAGRSGAALGLSPRILVIRLRRLGDLLLITPTLRAIRLAYPCARIDVLVSAGFHHAVVGNRRIDQLLVLGRGVDSWTRMATTCHRRHYDIVLDLQSSPRSVPFVLLSGAPLRVGWKKRWTRDWVYNRLVPGWNAPVYIAQNTLRAAAAIGVPPPPDVRLELAVSAADRLRAAALCARAGIDLGRPLIAMSVVAQVARKAWPLERYARLADWLIRSHDAQIVLSSGSGELPQVQAVVNHMHERPALWNYGPTTVQGLGAIYERCALWIGNDGGPQHIATAVGCPTVVIIKRGDDRYWTDREEHDGCFALAVVPDGDSDSLASVPLEQVLQVAGRCLVRPRLAAS